MTQVFIWHDVDEIAGHLYVDVHPPDLLNLPTAVDEIRQGEIPDDLLEAAIQGNLPVDENHGNDSTWQPYWDAAQPFWTRPTKQGSDAPWVP